MKHAAILVAAGRGTRSGSSVPKQYRPICGVPMLVWTARAILAEDEIDAVQIVIHCDDTDAYQEVATLIDDGRLLNPVFGGATRASSVKSGLEALALFAPDYVHIHDAARPFLSRQVLRRCMDALPNHQAVFPVLPMVDAMWSKSSLTPIDRADFLRAQTPQSFQFQTILNAHQLADPGARDDIEVAHAAGLDIVTVEGDEANFKVTTSNDFDRAENMARTTPDIRVGTGFDVHAFTDGNTVTLCGVEIPHDRGLLGHSDADVAMHAITDAIYGALAEGDIGQWFPPSDVQWKGAKSHIFLEHAMARAEHNGFTVNHLDCTIICEEPKVGPHAQSMREEISRITKIPMSNISVKATTSEKLGFTGRGEGIAAQAAATLVRP